MKTTKKLEDLENKIKEISERIRNREESPTDYILLEMYRKKYYETLERNYYGIKQYHNRNTD